MNRLLPVIIVTAMFAGSVAARADTTFTYQGSLSDAGEPANGSYNVDFALFDALSGGSQIGSTIQFNGLSVTDGFITVELDFGSSVYDGNQLWLEITVDGTELVPRQSITGTPYSIQTRGIFVDGVGNVGIGTTNPAWELEVANPTPGDGAECAVTADDAGGAVAAYSSTLPPPFDHFGGRVSLFANAITPGLDVRADAATGDIRFYTGGPWSTNERMRITKSGNVGIGTSSPGFPLQIVASDGEGIHVSVTDGLAIRAYSGGADTTCVSGYSSGTQGKGVVGITSDVNGYGVFGAADNQAGQSVGVFGAADSASGYDFFAGGMGHDYGSPSSIRWKRNIESIDDPLDKIDQLRGVYFDWDEEHGGHHDVGMIAEEVGAVLPEIVTYEENGIDAHGMDYSKLTPLLVEAINALRTERDTEIESLRAENNILHARIGALERLVERIASIQQEGITKQRMAEELKRAREQAGEMRRNAQ